MAPKYSIKVFTTADKEQSEMAYAIRRQVFVEEQNVSPEEEYDEFEGISRHFLLFDDGQPAGTARWRHTEKGIKLERFAVLPAYRNRGAGSLLVKSVLDEVKEQGKTVYLHAQVAAMKLYERAGFKSTGPLFFEAGIPHYKMVLEQPGEC